MQVWRKATYLLLCRLKENLLAKIFIIFILSVCKIQALQLSLVRLYSIKIALITKQLENCINLRFNKYCFNHDNNCLLNVVKLTLCFYKYLITDGHCWIDGYEILMKKNTRSKADINKCTLVYCTNVVFLVFFVCLVECITLSSRYFPVCRLERPATKLGGC